MICPSTFETHLGTFRPMACRGTNSVPYEHQMLLKMKEYLGGCSKSCPLVSNFENPLVHLIYGLSHPG